MSLVGRDHRKRASGGRCRSRSEHPLAGRLPVVVEGPRAQREAGHRRGCRPHRVRQGRSAGEGRPIGEPVVHYGPPDTRAGPTPLPVRPLSPTARSLPPSAGQSDVRSRLSTPRRRRSLRACGRCSLPGRSTDCSRTTPTTRAARPQRSTPRSPRSPGTGRGTSSSSHVTTPTHSSGADPGWYSVQRRSLV